ncbi:hypothetical protein L3Q82_000041 [Scortum barcoo]|uniref:Uncharacterized protein n=1 Tax=Scortum barcoo TaxID=214431 RepID=A0ACB8XB98_9TELE|nr:hypothetical protein L3Q82_000041 [Scortum barcoo]
MLTRHHTDPIIYTVDKCRLDGRKKTSKRREKSLERPSKRRRTSHSPSEGCSRMLRGFSSEHAGTSAAVYTGPPDSAALGGTPELSRPFSEPVLGTGETKTRSKRKSTSDEEEERPRKRSRGSNSAEDRIQTISGSSSEEEAGTSIFNIASMKNTQRKTKEPRKRSRKTPSPNEDPSQQATIEASSSEQPSASSSSNTPVPGSRAAFDATYEEGEVLGQGGFATVFAGYRKEDNLPVAIKHIPHYAVERRSMVSLVLSPLFTLGIKLVNGKLRMVPLEVALMLKIQMEGDSAAVTLLDWYDLSLEVILVLERPVPCVDLVDYANSRMSPLPEHEAKIITKQLVDALIEIHARGVFHRDIKLDNILIETGSDVPRVRLIDFGCGTIFSDRVYFKEPGTYEYASPEWFQVGEYTAVPTTVWQLGVVLYGMLHRRLAFRDSDAIVNENPPISDSLSFGWPCIHHHGSTGQTNLLPVSSHSITLVQPAASSARPAFMKTHGRIISCLPSLNRHLTVVEGFVCPNDPRSYVVGGITPLVGSPMANRS